MQYWVSNENNGKWKNITCKYCGNGIYINIYIHLSSDTLLSFICFILRLPIHQNNLSCFYLCPCYAMGYSVTGKAVQRECKPFILFNVMIVGRSVENIHVETSLVRGFHVNQKDAKVSSPQRKLKLKPGCFSQFDYLGSDFCWCIVAFLCQLLLWKSCEGPHWKCLAGIETA